MNVMKPSISIENISAREILDSRGNPTIEVTVSLSDDSFGTASVPSGASTGKYEAVELRDGDKTRFNGLGVLKAVSNVNNIINKALKGRSPFNQTDIDTLLINLDGSESKSKLGANAILGTSMATLRAAANSKKEPLYKHLTARDEYILPVPLMNILNGGKHASNSTDFQEFMIVPVNSNKFSEALRMGTEIYHALKSVIKKKGLNTNVGDEGGFAPFLNSNREAIELIIDAINQAGYTAGLDCFIALDPAASSFYYDDKYILAKENKKLNRHDMVDYYVDLCKSYPIISIEDGLAEDDWDGWCLLYEKLGSKIQIVGDDLFTTNIKRINMGIDKKAANSVLIKLNQIGTVTETLKAIETAYKAGWTSVISHRSGETEDSFIADLATAVGCGQIKTGAPCRSERVVKYNRLLKIEAELEDKAIFPSKKAFRYLRG